MKLYINEIGAEDIPDKIVVSDEYLTTLEQELNTYMAKYDFDFITEIIEEGIKLSIRQGQDELFNEFIPKTIFIGDIDKDKDLVINDYFMTDNYLGNYMNRFNSHTERLLRNKSERLLRKENLNMVRKLHIKEDYKDSDAYKKLADYDYVCDVKGNKVIIKWADDGHTYAEFTLYSPEEMFTDTDIDPYDDFGKSHGFDCWVIYNGDEYIDTYAKTYDDAVVSAIKYFWTYY